MLEFLLKSKSRNQFLAGLFRPTDSKRLKLSSEALEMLLSHGV